MYATSTTDNGPREPETWEQDPPAPYLDDEDDDWDDEDDGDDFEDEEDDEAEDLAEAAERSEMRRTVAAKFHRATKRLTRAA